MTIIELKMLFVLFDFKNSHQFKKMVNNTAPCPCSQILSLIPNTLMPTRLQQHRKYFFIDLMSSLFKVVPSSYMRNET
jgi:hypothetical protein